MNKKESNNEVGEAYAFFNCSASYNEIQAELPTIRELTQVPSELELSLFEGTDKLDQSDPELRQLIGQANEAGMRYSMKASLKGYSNKRVADEISGILNQAYNSPLYKDKEEFRGEIAYKEQGKYVLRD